MQKSQDADELLFVASGRLLLLRAWGIRNIRVPADPYKFSGNALRRQNEIHAVGGHGGLRHAGELRAGRLLSKRHATRGFDGLNARRAIRASAGKDYPDRPASTLVSQGPQEAINGHVSSRRLRTRGQLERPGCDDKIDVGRHDVYMVGFHSHAIGRLTDWHGGGSRKNLRQQAVVIWIEMLNEYDGESSVVWQIAEQQLENFQSARGGSDADNRNDRLAGMDRSGHFPDGAAKVFRFHLRPDIAGHLFFVHMPLPARNNRER